jgi:hypothetical protein
MAVEVPRSAAENQAAAGDARFLRAAGRGMARR